MFVLFRKKKNEKPQFGAWKTHSRPLGVAAVVGMPPSHRRSPPNVPFSDVGGGWLYVAVSCLLHPEKTRTCFMNVVCCVLDMLDVVAVVENIAAVSRATCSCPCPTAALIITAVARPHSGSKHALFIFELITHNKYDQLEDIMDVWTNKYTLS